MQSANLISPKYSLEMFIVHVETYFGSKNVPCIDINDLLSRKVMKKQNLFGICCDLALDSCIVACFGKKVCTLILN